MIISKKNVLRLVGLEIFIDGLSTGQRYSLKRYLSRRLVSPPVLFRTIVVLYHVN